MQSRWKVWLVVAGCLLVGIYLSSQFGILGQGGEVPFSCQKETQQFGTSAVFDEIVTCRVMVDEVEIRNVIANRGNCDVYNLDPLFIPGEEVVRDATTLRGYRGVFGDTITVRTCVGDLLELEIVTASHGRSRHTWQ